MEEIEVKAEKPESQSAPELKPHSESSEDLILTGSWYNPQSGGFIRNRAGRRVIQITTQELTIQPGNIKEIQYRVRIDTADGKIYGMTFRPDQEPGPEWKAATNQTLIQCCYKLEQDIFEPFTGPDVVIPHGYFL